MRNWFLNFYNTLGLILSVFVFGAVTALTYNTENAWLIGFLAMPICLFGWQLYDECITRYDDSNEKI